MESDAQPDNSRSAESMGGQDVTGDTTWRWTAGVMGLTTVVETTTVSPAELIGVSWVKVVVEASCSDC